MQKQMSLILLKMPHMHLYLLFKHTVSHCEHYHNNNNTNININILDKGKGCELLTKKTFEVIKDETLATIFAMAQQNSIKLACQMTFKQDLYVYLTNLVLYLFICF